MLAPPNPAMQAPMPAQPQLPVPVAPPKFHDVTVKRVRKYQQARVMGVPPEEFGIARNARTIKECGYCFHDVVTTAAELIAQGYDEEQVNNLPSYTGLTNIETQARDTVDEQVAGQGDDGINTATRQVRITEHYVKMDYDGEGVALWKVTTGERDSELLRNEDEDNPCRMDYIPFAAMTPVIVTHRFFGRSIADLVMDIQRQKTALLRGFLDNLYAGINPRPVVSESGANESTLDDLLVSRHGAPIRVKGAAGDAITWQEVPDVGPKVMTAMQYLDATREWRTGVSRQGQGVDPNALQNQVATIANQMYTASQGKLKLIARIFAETGVKDLFLLLHAVIRKHGSEPQTVQLRNQWVPINPRDWKTRNDMTVAVGLGTGDKNEQMVHLNLIKEDQTAAIMGGAGIVSKQNLFNLAKERTRLAGHKDSNTFFTDPSTPVDPNNPNAAPLPPPPDPKAAADQQKQAAEVAKIQADMQHQQMKTQADMHMQGTKLQADLTMAQEKHALDLQLAQQKHQMEMQKLEAQLKTHAIQAAVDVGHAQETHAVKTNAAKEQHSMKMEQANTPKASIEVKHGAEELTGPLSKAIEQMGEHLKAHTEHQHKALATVLEKVSAPRTTKIHRDAKGKVSHSTTQ